MTSLLLLLAAMVSVKGSVGADSRPLAGNVDGTAITVATPHGDLCRGQLLKMRKDGGLGNLHCTDGRSGSFEWTVWSASLATGDGTLGGEPLKLTFEPNRK